MMKPSHLAFLLAAHHVFTCTAYAFDPTPLLNDTTGLMKLTDLRDGKRSIYARIEDTKDGFRADLIGMEIRAESTGVYRFEQVLPSTPDGSVPFWLKVSSSGVFVEHDGELFRHGKIPFLLIPPNGQVRATWRNKNSSGEEIEVETVVGTTETVKTPSGEHVALKVEYGAAAGSCLTEPCDGCLACEAFWFSPGSGLVSYEATSGGNRLYLIAQGGKDLSLNPKFYKAALERFSRSFPRRFN
jgi:hypothetical protein